MNNTQYRGFKEIQYSIEENNRIHSVSSTIDSETGLLKTEIHSDVLKGHFFNKPIFGTNILKIKDGDQVALIVPYTVELSADWVYNTAVIWDSGSRFASQIDANASIVPIGDIICCGKTNDQSNYWKINCRIRGIGLNGTTLETDLSGLISQNEYFNWTLFYDSGKFLASNNLEIILASTQQIGSAENSLFIFSGKLLIQYQD